LRRQRLSRIGAGVTRPTSMARPGKVRPGTVRAKFMEFGGEDSKRGKRLRRRSLNLSMKLRKAGRDF
jgi:hypothetical protein